MRLLLLTVLDNKHFLMIDLHFILTCRKLTESLLLGVLTNIHVLANFTNKSIN